MSEGGGGSGVLREILAAFGFEIETEGLKKGENALEEFGGKLKTFAEGIAGAFAVHELYEFAEANVHAMTAIEHAAAQIGVSTEEVQAWQFAAKSAGFEADKFTNAMSRLQVAQQLALTGNGGTGTNPFRQLGISVKDASGNAKAADEIFSDVAEAISKTTDPTKRAAIATQLFGRSGRELLPFLSKGKEGIKDLLDEYKQLGGGYTEDAMEKGKAFEEQQARLNSVWTRTKSIVAAALLPALTKLSEWVTKGIKWFNQLAKNSEIVRAALLALGAMGAYFAVEMAIAFAPILLAAAAVAALVLVLDDLLVFFKGGHSVIGHYIDQIFGKGTSAKVIEEARDIWASIVEYLDKAVALVQKVIDGFHKVKDFGGKIGDIVFNGTHLEEPNGPDDPLARLIHRLKHGENAESASKRALFPEENRSLGSGVGSPLVSQSNVSVTVNVPPGLNEKQVGEHVANHVDRVIKNRHRAAMTNLPRVNPT